MAVIHESDTILGSSLVSNITDGINVTRRFVVKELTGNPSAITANALKTNGIPKPGDAHPDIIGLFVETINVNPIAAAQCEVIVNYTPFVTEDEEEAFLKKRISATVQSVETNLFFNNQGKKEIMTTKYEYPDATTPATVKTNPDIQVGRVNKEQPSVVISIDIIETEDPFEKILEFQGKINSAFYAGGAKGTWLLANVETETNDGGETWTSQYQFQYNPETWVATVAYVNPETNKPPVDVGIGKNKGALVDYRIYEQIDFKKLGLGG